MYLFPTDSESCFSLTCLVMPKIGTKKNSDSYRPVSSERIDGCSFFL